MGDAGLHHQCTCCGPCLRWCAGETNATLIDQIHQDRHGRQQRKVTAIARHAAVGSPWLIGEADAEEEGIVIDRSALPQAFGQLRRPAHDFGQVEVGPADVVELGLEGKSRRIDHGHRLLRLLGAAASAAQAPVAVASRTIRFGFCNGRVAWCAHEVELPQRCRGQRFCAVVDHRVEPEDAMADAESLLLPLRRVGRQLTVEVALVGCDGDDSGVFDDELAARHQDLAERQRRDVGSPCGSQ